MTSRRSRATRPEPGNYALTERDLELLFAVGRMGVSTSHQLQRLFFSDRSAALRRFAKLASMKLLDVAVTSQDKPNVYTLGSQAIGVLKKAGFSTDDLHRSKVGKSVDLHLQVINDLRVLFVLGAQNRHDVELIGFLGDLDLRRRAGSPPPAYVPDALVTLTLPTGMLNLVVEVDLGTEGVAVFKGKVEATVELWSGRLPCWGAPTGSWRPVVFVPDSTRARSLSRGIVEAHGGELWLVAELDVVREDGIFGRVFATAREVAECPKAMPLRYWGSLVPDVISADAEVSQ